MHGVVVTDPALAATLRRCGAFSGKRVRLGDLPEFDRGYVTGERGRVTPVVAPAGDRMAGLRGS